MRARDVFKDICIVKREELELMDEAVKLHKELVEKRKRTRARKLYSQDDIKRFEEIAKEMRMVKRRITEFGKFMMGIHR